MAKVLLIEDDPASARLLLDILQRGGHEVASATNGEQGVAAATQQSFEIVVTDWKMSGMDGFDVIRTLHLVNPQLPVILITGFLTPKLAVRAERLGAYACVRKPQRSRFLSLLEHAAHEPILGSSRAMQTVWKSVGMVATTDLSVLIRGEQGSGRTSVAAMIHRHSHRASQPFVLVDCARLSQSPPGESPGTLCFEEKMQEAKHGTLFLQHVGRLSDTHQRRLLRVLMDGARPSARVIATIDVGGEMVIRQDLYYRLAEFVIQTSPLREHAEDIPELVKDFIVRYADSSSMPKATMMHYLQRQPWPGNVRQFRAVLGKALVVARGSPLTPHLIEPLLRSGRAFGVRQSHWRFVLE